MPTRRGPFQWRPNETPEERAAREEKRFQDYVRNTMRFGYYYATKKLMTFEKIAKYARSRAPYSVGQRLVIQARKKVLPNWKPRDFISPRNTKAIMREFLRELGERKLSRMPSQRTSSS
jgi:hypothetical protein